MTRSTRAKNNASADDKPADRIFLGDFENVATILRDFFQQCDAYAFAYAEGTLPKEGFDAAVEAAVGQRALVLLGGYPEEYAPCEGWNEAGGIDLAVSYQLNIAETEPAVVITTALRDFLARVHRLKAREKNGQIDRQTRDLRIEETVTEFTGFFVIQPGRDE